MKQEQPQKITISLNFLYYTVAAVTFGGILASIIAYVPFGKTRYPFIPSVSECMVDFPVTHIFGPTLSITSALLICYGLIRDHVSGYLISQKFMYSRKKPAIIRLILKVLLVLSVVGLFLLANCNVHLMNGTHNTSASLFFISLTLYHIIDDYLFSSLGLAVPFYSSVISWSNFGCLLCFTLLREVIGPHIYDVISISSFFEYAGILLLVVKFLVNGYNFPSHFLSFSIKPRQSLIGTNSPQEIYTHLPSE